MRKSTLILLTVLAVFNLPLFAQPKKKAPYVVEFDRNKDIERLDISPDGTKKGIYIKVRFFITLDGSKVENVGNEYKLIIEEDGHQVKVVDLQRPVVSQDLSVMLALDTSGSMKEHGRMEQARAAADFFLNKLPAPCDCGLILFDHEIREKLPPTFERERLVTKVHLTQPRGGTAFLDAASEAIAMLRSTRRGRDRAVVLMTDGIDLNSKKNIDQVIAEAKRDRVPVYTIGIGEPGKLERVNTALALDHSGSMKPPADSADTTPKIEAMHIAAERFVDSMSSLGRCSIVPFSSKVGMPQPFREKSQADAIKKEIRNLFPKGETALFDATYDAISTLEADATRGRRAVVAMTDGIDNSSRRRVEEVIARAKEARIPLYMLGFGRDGEIDEFTMRQMADATGGKYYHAKNKDSLLEIFENLSIQLHDDGIDEVALKKLAKETDGQYYPAKNVSELKLILAKVSQDMPRKRFEEVFESKFQASDGTLRNITLKLVQRGAGGDTVLVEREGNYQERGLVVAEMNHVVYLALLVILGVFIALPGLFRRTPAA